MSRLDPYRDRGLPQRLPGTPGPPEPPVSERVALIVLAVVAMGGAVFALQRSSATSIAATEVPEAEAIAPPVRPIDTEAQVFRVRPGMFASPEDAGRRPTAHPRTLATYRALRSYPGAPPRVPHSLTAEEFRAGRCNTCHERGGYVPRFAAYAPVSPHPQLTQCLQCHAMNDALAGVPFPGTGPDDRCRQCHAGISGRFVEAGLDWKTVAWPEVTGRAAGVVPIIPHDLEMRGNCLACHMAPGAVAEIRVTHPERSDCRACHVTTRSASDIFTRPGTDGGSP